MPLIFTRLSSPYIFTCAFPGRVSSRFLCSSLVISFFGLSDLSGSDGFLGLFVSLRFFLDIFVMGCASFQSPVDGVLRWGLQRGTAVFLLPWYCDYFHRHCGIYVGLY